MPDDEKELYNILLGKFHYSMSVYHDYWNRIVRSSIVNLINVEKLHIDSKEGDNETILQRFETEVRKPGSKKFELNLRGEDGSLSKLIYYFPESPTSDGHVFLSEPEKKKITEFTQFEKIDEKIPAVKARNHVGDPTDYYVRNFGARIRTFFEIEEGTVVNEFDIVNTLNEFEYPRASVGESVSTIRFYESIGAEDFDFDNPFITVKYTKPGESGTKNVSTVDKIIKELRKQMRPNRQGVYYFNDIKESYEIPDYGESERSPRRLDYIRNLFEANEDLVRTFVNNLSKKAEEVSSRVEGLGSLASRKGTPLIQREVVETIVEKQEPLVVKSEEPIIKVDEIKKPILLMPEVENKHFLALTNKIKEYFRFMPSMSGRKSEIIGELIIDILKKEGLHFKFGENLLKSIEDCAISSEGFELIDEDGRQYRITVRDSARLITIVGENKVINIKSGYYPHEKPKNEFGSETKFEGFEVTTIGVRDGGVYKNQNNIVFNMQYGSKNQRNQFLPKFVETEYYSKDILSSLGIKPEDIIKSALFQISYHSDDNDPFMELHKYGPVYADIDKTELNLDRKEYISGLNGCPADDKEFCALYIGQNIEANYLAMEEFLSQHHIQAR